MVDYQLPLPGLARDFHSLTPQEKDFIAYFSALDLDSVSPVIDYYAGIGPKGYNVFLILARIIKVKERILSDRQLADALSKNDLYRFVTRDIQPAHNTFNTLRKRLGIKGFVEIHKRFVLRAHSLFAASTTDVPASTVTGSFCIKLPTVTILILLFYYFCIGSSLPRCCCAGVRRALQTGKIRRDKEILLIGLKE